MPSAAPLRYLHGHPAEVLARVQALLDEGRLLDVVLKRYPERHEIRTDRALYTHVLALKNRFMRNAPPLAKVAYDSTQLNRPQAMLQTLGTHTTIARVQGGRLKAKREIRIASVFKEAPARLLEMIVVHELAHLKEPDHDRAFYALCTHMAADYPQLEFDARLWLTALEAGAAAGRP